MQLKPRNKRICSHYPSHSLTHSLSLSLSLSLSPYHGNQIHLSLPLISPETQMPPPLPSLLLSP